MLQGINDKGELKNVKVNDDGSIKTSSSNVKTNENGAVKVVVDGQIQQTSDREIVLNSSVLTIGIEATEVEVNKKVTNIMVANYSETADITINTGSTTLQVGANLALDLPINMDISTLSITSTENDTKIQLVIKGVE